MTYKSSGFVAAGILLEGTGILPARQPVSSHSPPTILVRVGINHVERLPRLATPVSGHRQCPVTRCRLGRQNQLPLLLATLSPACRGSPPSPDQSARARPASLTRRSPVGCMPRGCPRRCARGPGHI